MQLAKIKEVLSLSIPAIGETILYTVITMFDILLVGRFGGKNDLSAVGLSSQIIVTFSDIFIIIGLTTALISVIARNVGAADTENAEKYASLGFGIALIISIITSSLFYYFPSSFLKLAGARGEVLYDCSIYIRICSIGIFFSMLANTLCSIIKGYADTYTPFLCACITIFINLILDIFLIKNHRILSITVVQGAAFSKILSQFTGFIFIFLYSLLKSKIKIRIKYILNFNLQKVKNLLAIYIPSSMEEGAISISQLLSNVIIMHTGTTAFAANQIANTVESISFMPSVGLSFAATTITGIYIGRKNYREAEAYSKTCCFLGILITSFFSLLFFFIPNFLIHFFISGTETQVIKFGADCLKIGAFEQVSLSVSIILTGAFKGLGDARTPLAISLIASWAIRIPLMYYFIYLMRMPVTYVWYITCIQWGFDAIATTAIFRFKLKKHFSIFI